MEYDFRRKATSLFIGLLLILTSTLAFGQGIVTGSISGTIQDQQQAVVSGAKVTAVNTETNREFTTETNSVGAFSLPGLPTGTYTVTVEAAKFQKLRFTNVPVTVAKDSALGIKTLTIGAEEVVNVESTPPLVETSTTQISTSFAAKAVADLPIGNGFDLLALFVPGIVPAGSAGFSNSNGADISSNGQRGRSNNFMIDGQQNNDNSVAGPSLFLGNQDVIAEFQVITNYSAEFGRNTGSVINTITKSGTNAFHGTAYEYHYNKSVFDSFANEEKSDVFGFCQADEPNGPDGLPNSGDEDCVPVLSRVINNRFGGTIGGPVLKDKFWFFGSAHWERLRAAGGAESSGSSLTPTPTGLTQLAAAFPGNPAVAALQTIGPYGVTLGNPTPGSVITPRTVSDGVTAAVIDFAPVNRFIPSASNDRQFSGRGDIQVTSKDRFFARYIIEDFITQAAAGRFAAGAFVDVPGRTQQIGLDWTRTWSSRFVSTFRFNYSRAGFGFEGGSFPDCTQGNIFVCPTGITLQSTNVSFGMQNNLPQGRLVNVSQWQGNASWVTGRHTLKFGGEYGRQRSPNVFLPNINGTYTYSSAIDNNGVSGSPSCAAQFGALINNGSGSACSFSRFLADLPSSGTGLALTDGPPKFNFKEQDFGLYFQDEFKAKDNLTLIMGIRYEFFQQAVNLLNDLTVANQAGPNPFWDTTLDPSLTTLPRVREDKNNWAPNIGFAWTPRFWQGLFGQDKTVIRGGFRISYDPSYYNIFLNVATAAPVVNAGALSLTTCTAPCFPTSGFLGSDVRALHLSDIPTGGNPGSRNQTLVTTDFHNPYSQQWNFGMQRQIGAKMAMEARYVGNHTVGNFVTENANPSLTGLINNGFGSLIPSGLTPCNTAGTPGDASNRVDCNRTNVRLRSNNAYSIYHALQTRFDVSNWHGVTLGAAYTWSKTLDNVSEIFSTFSGGNTVAASQNPFDISVAERGLSGISYPHVLTVYWNYDLPWYKSQQGLMGHLLGGWSLNSTYRYTSGQPYTPAQFSGSNSSCQGSWEGAFFSSVTTCRPIELDPGAALDTAGIFCDGSPDQCLQSLGGVVPQGFGTLVSLYDPCLFSFDAGLDGIPGTADDGGCAVTPISTAHWLLNDDTASTIFGTPFAGVSRNTLRGDTIQAVNLSVFKTTNITERVKLRFEAQAFNILNRQFRGIPDPFLEDFNFAEGNSSFGNTFFNDTGGDSVNATYSGIGRRRLVFGLKVIF